MLSEEKLHVKLHRKKKLQTPSEELLEFGIDDPKHDEQ